MMAHSKDVLAVMGLLCVNRKFREGFFKDPQGAAKSFVGKLTADEVKQIDNLAGKGALPSKYGGKRDAFVNDVQGQFQQICDSYNCPSPPCPYYSEE
jgi:hypothetical protein